MPSMSVTSCWIARRHVVDDGVEPRVDRAGGADDHDLVVVAGVERAGERVGGLELARTGHEPVEAGEVGGERDEFGLEGRDEELHRSHCPRAPVHLAQAERSEHRTPPVADPSRAVLPELARGS